MKILNLTNLLSFMMLILFASCNENEGLDTNHISGTGLINFGLSEASTKTSYDATDKLRINWEDGDRVKISCEQSQGVKEAVYEVLRSTTAANEGRLRGTSSSLLVWNLSAGDHIFYGAYPGESATITGSKITCKCAVNQTVTATGDNIFTPDMKAAYMVAKSTAKQTSLPVKLDFVPAFTALDIEIPVSATIPAVTLSSLTVTLDNRSQYISADGVFILDCSDLASGYTFTHYSGAPSSIGFSANISEPVTIEPGTKAVITLLLPPVAIEANSATITAVLDGTSKTIGINTPIAGGARRTIKMGELSMDYIDAASSKLSIVPLPEIVSYNEKAIMLPSKITISSSLDDTMQELLKKTLNGALALSTEVRDNGSSFISVKQDISLDKEEYLLEITDKGITISYSEREGLLWGVQSLRQTLEQSDSYNSDSKKYVLSVSVKDKPKYAWRGFHIDLARHMFTIDYLKKTIDYLSLYKINKLHLHLTDDQGWRIEIKNYPLLTKIGAWRKFDEYDIDLVERAKTDSTFTLDSRFVRGVDEYGGFYSQDEMKGLVEYARQRGIDVIPEIDMPGHMTAAIRAYNDIACLGQAGWAGEFSDPLCPAKESNYVMIKRIIDELLDVFQSEYFHMGADEVSLDIWDRCENCQKMMAENNFIYLSQLQLYFVKNISNYLRQKGKKVLVWDDAFDESLPKDITYFFWRDWVTDNPGRITQSGAKMVFMDWDSFYLSADVSENSISSLYNYTISSRYPNVVETNLLGYQACVFTEHIPNEIIFEEHVYPSLQAFSEVAWGSRRDYSQFGTRMKWHMDMMSRNNIHYTECSF